MDARLKDLLQHEPEWLSGSGPMADVVVSSRVRLARNVKGLSFPTRMTTQEADQLAAATSESLRGLTFAHAMIDPRSLAPADAEFVIERNLATRDLIDVERPTLVYCRTDGLAGVMVNEEDHFRIQGFAAGMDVDAAFARAQELEQHLRQSFDFAVSDRFGFLTSCPTNTGSGMRTSLMLHLPALARTKAPLQRTLQAARSASLAVRGVHGEGSRTLGQFYQISNQRTLGTASAQQMKAVADFGEVVTSFERKTRSLFRNDSDRAKDLHEDLVKSLDLLRTSVALTSAQALQALSTLRLGSLVEATDSIGFACSSERLLSLCFKLQPGHLQALKGEEMSPEQRDVTRASWMRQELGFPAC